jgi:hypothetical protein
MKTQLLILALTIIISSCKESNITNDYVEYEVEFSLVDQNGDDLLDPEHPNHIKESDIKLTYFMEASFKNPETGAEVNFTDEKPEGLLTLFLQPNYTNNYQEPITLVEWGDLKTDTLRAKHKRSDNGIFIEKLWINNEIVFDVFNQQIGTGRIVHTINIK